MKCDGTGKGDTQTNLIEYIDLWRNEQKLRGLSDLTVNNYLYKVKMLLNEYTKPDEFEIKRFLTAKQESGSYSGTIANYVKAFRSFFGYLFERKLYNFDPRCLALPKITSHHSTFDALLDLAALRSILSSEFMIVLELKRNPPY